MRDEPGTGFLRATGMISATIASCPSMRPLASRSTPCSRTMVVGPAAAKICTYELLLVMERTAQRPTQVRSPRTEGCVKRLNPTLLD